MKIIEPSSSFASSSKLMALQLVHPIKGSAYLYNIPNLLNRYNKTINFISFHFKGNHSQTKTPRMCF